ncbi:MAG: DUF488 family protein [Actinomycetota bacterium]
MEICSIGFTKRTAEDFFGALKTAQVKQLIDVRLNNISQLAGFAKRDDLRFFLQSLLGIPYRHEPLLAPTQEMLDEYKKKRGSWADYEKRFINLMEVRAVERVLPKSYFQPRAVLLCSELEPAKCHRRLVIEYLDDRWGGVTAVHL